MRQVSARTPPAGIPGLLRFPVFAGGEASIASVGTTNLGATHQQSITITGTTTITSFGSSADVGVVKFVKFSGALQLTHNATSMILPNAGSNIMTTAGDCLIARHEGSGNWRVLDYQKADGTPLVGGGGGTPGLAALTSGTISNQATLDIVLTSYTAYRGIVIHLQVVPVTDNAVLYCRFSTDGGFTYYSGASDYDHRSTGVATAAFTVIRAGDSKIEMAIAAAGIGNASEEGWKGVLWLLDQANTALRPTIHYQATYQDSATPARGLMIAGSGTRLAAQDTDAIRFLFSSGNLSTGRYDVYGMA
jgi:hypothetical protein